MKTEKYIIAFDTICDGYQVETDENNIPSPELFETYEDAFREMFTESILGIEGNEEYLDNKKERKQMINKMKSLVKENNVKKMIKYFDKNPEANYYESFVEKVDDFILGRKAIFNNNGIEIFGTKLTL